MPSAKYGLTVSVHKSKTFCTNAENRNSENDATDCHRPGGLQLLRRNRILVSRGRRKPYSLAAAISATPVDTAV